MRRMRQTVGEKQTFLVQAKSYKTISDVIWVAIVCYAFIAALKLPTAQLQQ